MVLVDHALRHGGGGERQVVALDHPAQQRGIGDAHAPMSRASRSAASRRRSAQPRARWRRPARGGALPAWRAPAPARWSAPAPRLPAGRDAPDPSARDSASADRFAHGLGDAALFQAQGRLGDRLEQRVVVDPHLDAAAELIGVEVAGDRDHRRAVEPGVSRPRSRDWWRPARAWRCRAPAPRSSGR